MMIFFGLNMINRLKQGISNEKRLTKLCPVCLSETIAILFCSLTFTGSKPFVKTVPCNNLDSWCIFLARMALASIAWGQNDPSGYSLSKAFFRSQTSLVFILASKMVLCSVMGCDKYWYFIIQRIFRIDLTAMMEPFLLQTRTSANFARGCEWLHEQLVLSKALFTLCLGFISHVSEDILPILYNLNKLDWAF